MAAEESFIKALQAGEKKYTATAPCPTHGSPVERYTKNKGCVLCIKALSRRQYLSSRSRIKRITLDVHVDDRDVLELFAKQLLEARV
jgi:hypothetical protein